MGLTQEQFAREVGVTFSTVNLWRTVIAGLNLTF